MPATKKGLKARAQKLGLIQSDIFEEWQLSLNSDSTRENYRNHLAYFCGYHSVKASDLKAKEVNELRDMCKAYLLYLKKNAKDGAGPRIHGEVHVNSLPIYMSGVKSYLDYLEKPLVWKKINHMLPEQTMSEVRSYTREEIQKLLSFADPREKAAAFIMICGVRRGGVAALKVGNFEVFHEPSNIGMVWVYAKAKRWRYFTLLTPEATKAVQAYLSWRTDHGETLTPDAPLIRDKFDVFTSRRTKPKHLKPDSVYKLMARLLQHASISDFTISPDHSFRHYFDTMVINANVNERFKKYWMGHKAGLGLDTRYFDPRNPESRQALLSEFLKAVNLLTIDEAQRTQVKLEKVTAEKEKLQSTYDDVLEFMKEYKRDHNKP